MADQPTQLNSTQPLDHQAWAEGQVQALIAIGVSEADAQRTVRRVLGRLPPGADPNTWISPEEDLDEPITEADIEDAKAAWEAPRSLQF